jgi:uncharacterized membrane protein YedE/YeeE
MSHQQDIPSYATELHPTVGHGNRFLAQSTPQFVLGLVLGGLFFIAVNIGLWLWLEAIPELRWGIVIVSGLALLATVPFAWAMVKARHRMRQAWLKRIEDEFTA